MSHFTRMKTKLAKKEQIVQALRRWLVEGRARSASFSETDAALKEQVKIPDFGAAPAIEVETDM